MPVNVRQTAKQRLKTATPTAYRGFAVMSGSVHHPSVVGLFTMAWELPNAHLGFTFPKRPESLKERKII